MKKLSLFTLLVVFVSLSSCGSGDNLDDIIKYTTEKTVSITKIKIENIKEKLPVDEIVKDTLSGKFTKKDSKILNRLLASDDSGIDMNKPYYIIVDEQKKDFIFTSMMWIDDEEKFKATLTEMSNMNISFDKNLIYSGNSIIGSLEDDLVMFTKFSKGYNSFDYDQRLEQSIEEISFYKDFWKRKGMEDKESLSQIEEALNTDKDAGIWINLHALLSFGTNGYIETLAVNKLLLHSGLSFDVNFEKGKAVFHTNTFFNEDLQKLVSKHFDDKELNYELLKNINVDQADMYSLAFLSMDFIKHFVKEAGLEASANNFLEKSNLTFEEIIEAFTGDYLVLTYPEKPIKPSNDPYDAYGYYTNYPKPNTLFCMGINGSKASKIIKLITQQNLPMSQGTFYHNDKIMAFATESENLDLLRNNKIASNKKLKKERGLMGYSWANGAVYNKMIAQENAPFKCKIEELVSTSVIKDGNFTSDGELKIDKKEKNILHYVMGYE